ncbi:30S ribosomal protein S6--L-glutamate ligase [Candidatus Pantoea edessiphila]|uniref:30S ribosomal protein S6--L-glutamate ligase n=1 Tax=Candidatus Pantoea edessiphila TaxID=2044610 RepID=A0A2P5SYZ0_9GAMM|nr:30S ribosomal protein S6--L-glutamate ligase [Candidatus Pantoea edessiphila]MBK4775317.1 30S ribosomal protein S6--L-glutamate ligase [Pantoea sp. Edef]PPI87546.1 30S ribosomal protein S6--L-glutamate ligase [Candidatus Pantoea edessiphila]
MKIAILSRDRTLYSCCRLIKMAEHRGHYVQVIDPLLCNLQINAIHPSIYYNGQLLDHFDAIIPRIGISSYFYGINLLRQFEICGSYSLNKSISISKAHDKLHSLQLLSEAGIDIPITSCVSWFQKTEQLTDLVGGVPLIIKLVEGSQGVGVIIAETYRAAESIIDAFRIMNANILIQEFIKEANGCDLRCLVLDKKVVASIERKSKEGDFRSNLHQGGKAYHVDITEKERFIAIKAAEILNLELVGVDIIRSNRGPLITEINISPGLEGIENISGLNIAGKIIDLIEKKYLDI